MTLQVNEVVIFLEEPKMHNNSTGQRAERQLQTVPRRVRGLDALDLSSVPIKAVQSITTTCPPYFR